MKTKDVGELLRIGTAVLGRNGKMILSRNGKILPPDEEIAVATEAIVISKTGIVLSVFFDLNLVYYLFPLYDESKREELIKKLYQNMDTVLIKHPLDVLSERGKEIRVIVVDHRVMPFVGKRKAIREIADVIPEADIRAPRSLIQGWIKSTPYGVFYATSLDELDRVSNPKADEKILMEVRKWRR
jgi:hypothetical protein